MKFTEYIFMLFVWYTSLNASFLNQKDVKKFLNLLNPIATFQPSSISSGHAQYFEQKNELSNIQKSDTKIVLARLRYLRCFYSLVGTFLLFFEKRYKQISGMILLATSVSYSYEVKQFEKKLDQSLSNKTNNPSKND